jgi:transposase-like protein
MAIGYWAALKRLDPKEFRARIVRACEGRTLSDAAKALDISRRALLYYRKELKLKRRKDSLD